MANPTLTVMYVTVSSGSTPNNRPRISRTVPTPNRRPMPRPESASVMACLTTMRITLPRSAPSASRRPISRLRWLTL